MSEKRSDELIKKIHEVQVDLLDKFVEVCDKLNLKYSLSCGSLLGAVRHKGFIPWDDDVDVVMLRDEYEIFVKEGQKYLPEGYEIQHYYNSKYAIYSFARIRRNDTAWIHYFDEMKDDNCLGLAMDVFPIDRIKGDKERKIVEKKTRFYYALRWAYSSKNKFPSFAKNVIGKLFLHPLAKIYGRQKINKKQDDLEKQFGYGEYTCADIMEKSDIMPYSIFEEYIKLEFEGKKYSCIKDYHTYLTKLYGKDYMQLPPEDKRKMHFADVIDCDKSWKEYIGQKIDKQQ